jgi:chorismate mutase
MDPTLQEARERLDTIDHKILALVAERAEIVHALGQWKDKHGLARRDNDRENAMIHDRRTWAGRLGVPPWIAEALTRVVLVGARGMTDSDRLFFLGS